MKNLLRTVLLLIVVALTASVVYPCTCEIMRPGKKLRKAKAVFVGEVIVIGSNDKSEWATVAVRFKVERYWKGVQEQIITVIGAPVTAGTCGLPVKVGGKYLIYAFKIEEDQLETRFCASRLLEHAAEDFAVIGNGKALKLKD